MVRSWTSRTIVRSGLQYICCSYVSAVNLTLEGCILDTSQPPTSADFGWYHDFGLNCSLNPIKYRLHRHIQTSARFLNRFCPFSFSRSMRTTAPSAYHSHPFLGMRVPKYHLKRVIVKKYTRYGTISSTRLDFEIVDFNFIGRLIE